MEIEDDFGYLLRLLYEETFSVNQSPEKPYKGSLGLTVGGLISHCRPNRIVNGNDLIDYKDGVLRGGNLREILVNEEDLETRARIIELAELITFPERERVVNGKARQKLIMQPNEGFYPEDIDVFGTRLMLLVSNVEEVTQKVVDPELRKMIGMKDGVEINRMDFLWIVWKRICGKVLTTRGTYKTVDETNAKEGLKDLITLRTHPEMQFLYKFASASGPINEESNSQI